jgi:CBS domain-containing protein
MKVKDFLKFYRIEGPLVVTIGPDDSVQAATRKLVENNIGALPVCDFKGKLMGIVSERDLVRICSQHATEINRIKIKDVMISDVVTCTPEDNIEQVMETMTQHRIRHVPILVGEAVGGMISSRDVFREQIEECKLEIGYLSALHETAKALNSMLTPEDVFSAIVRITSVATRAKGCSLMLFDDKKKHLTRMATYGLSEEYLSKGLTIADPILADVMKGKAIIVSDVTTDPRVQYPKEAVKEGIASMLSVPLYSRGTPIGVIRIYSSKKEEFDGEVIKLLDAMNELGAIAIERSQMHDSLKKAHDVCLQELAQWQP